MLAAIPLIPTYFTIPVNYAQAQLYILCHAVLSLSRPTSHQYSVPWAFLILSFYITLFFFFCVTQEPHIGPGPPHYRRFTVTLRHSALWQLDQTQRPLPDNRQHFRPQAEFEPTISASERPQTHALDRAAIGIGNMYIYYVRPYLLPVFITRIYYPYLLPVFITRIYYPYLLPVFITRIYYPYLLPVFITR